MVDLSDYTELEGTGFEGYQTSSPEDDFFHSVYIAGISRKNHTGLTEEAGKLQVRGVTYNLDKVCMIITHVKQVLYKAAKGPDGKERPACFSFKKGMPPWFGWNNRECGTNSAERAANDFCRDCRAQIIVTGVFCEESGKPILGEDGKPTFVFLRGKGMKYKNVADFLSEVARKEFDPIIKPVTDDSKRFEQANVNNKRSVTNITVGEANSQYGIKKVFELSEGTTLPDKVVVDILNITKKTVGKFNEKFDWSKRGASKTASGYGEQQADPDGHQLPTSEAKPQEQVTETPKDSEKPQAEAFDFDGLEF